MFQISKYLVLLTSIFLLVACSIQGLAEKMLPEQVRAHALTAVDAVMEKDTAFFDTILNGQMSDEDFAIAVENMLSFVSDGAEIRRDIVSASSNVNVSAGNGSSKTYTLAYEIQTKGGFTVIDLDYVQTPEQSECCVLENINVSMSDASPYRIPLETAARIVKIVGLVILAGIVALVFFLVRRSRRKKHQ